MESRKILSFWYWLALIIVSMVGLLVAHYVTQSTPSAVAFVVPLLDLPVYWYGVVVMGALMFAATTVAQLVHERSLRVFQRSVSAEIYQQPTTLALPEHIAEQLEPNQVESIGELVWRYGLDPTRLTLPDDDRVVIEALLRNELESTIAASDRPVDDPPALVAPWRRWNPDHVWGSVMWALVFGLIGARLYHVLTPQPSMGITPADYFADPITIFNLRNGGLGIFGAIVGGALGLGLYVWRQRLPLADWLDLGALVGALAQAIGRWANYFNQELFGAPTNVPWAILIDRQFRPNNLAASTHYHPTFLYESLWSFGTFFLLYWLWRGEKIRSGEAAAIYLMLYGFGRILLETIRLDSNTTGGIATASLVSAGMIGIGMAYLVWSRVPKRPAAT